ncbi:MAG: hypothetical protein D3918_14630 [Candidatus Electrothrix sp. AX2]|nr:hypothetical protein [Candidatus Electrothrix gigas]
MINVCIQDLLYRNQQALNITCRDNNDIAGCFYALVQQAHSAFQSPVVVLVDEYDKPILDNLTRPDWCGEHSQKVGMYFFWLLFFFCKTFLPIHGSKNILNHSFLNSG